MGLDERIKYASMKARHKKILRPWYKKTWGIIVIILASLFLIFTIIFSLSVQSVIRQRNNPDQYNEDMAREFLARVNRKTANTFGPQDAPVTIVEFADFACSFCAASHPSLKAIREKYPQQVRIVYRDFPLHDNSIFLALSARCAGEQNEFWTMHDFFFLNQSRLELAQSELRELMPGVASELGLNVAQFEKCLDEQKYFPQIKQDAEDVSFLGLQGTPTWYINNTPFVGHLSVQELNTIVEGIIKSSSLPKSENY